jgi:hypothetical protein
MTRMRNIFLLGLAILVLAFAAPAFARADDSTSPSPAAPSLDGWTWDESAASTPDGWTWDEAAAADASA